MKARKLFFLKLALFLMLFIIISMVIESFLSSTRFPKLIELDHALQNGTKVIYFGDSVNFITPEHEPDRRFISGMLEDMLQDGKCVANISHGAYHLNIYAAYSHYICKSGYRPKVVVIPINLRTFSHEWNDRPCYQFEEEIDILYHREKLILTQRLWKRFIRVFGEKDTGTPEAWKKWKELDVYFDDKKIGKVDDFLYDISPAQADVENEVKKMFIFHYLYPLRPDHPLVQSLDTLIKNYKQHNVNIVIYITPVNFMDGVRYVGNDFVRIIKKNKAVISDVCKQNGVCLIDLSFDLEPKFFSYALIPNEHLTYPGRIYVASKLNECIRNMSPLHQKH